MSAADLRAAAPSVELAAAVVALATALVLLARIRRARTGPPAPALGRASEAGWLGAILLAAALWRLLFHAAPATPRWFFPETTALFAADALAADRPWAQWRELLGRTQVAWVHESAVMMPVATAFQALLGPSLALPTVVGAFWGVAAVLAAWLLGRAVRGPVFGLAFAALVAASPLQITWARLGGLQIGASAHVLLVAWLAWLAGTRAGVLLTLAAAAAAAASVYHYYAARAAIPLAAVAWGAGLAAGRPPARRVLRVLVVCAALAAAAAAAGRTWAPDGFWPRYGGYVGNQGERTPADLAATVATSVRREIPLAARAYFWRGRSRSTWGPNAVRGPDTPLLPGMATGGVALVPLALLGIAGLLLALRHPRRDAAWLALVVLGTLLPLLSRTSARRLLVFDLGWCALGATTLAVLAGGGRRVVPARRLGALLAVVLALGTWSFATVYALDDARDPSHPSVIPFGESGFNDGVSCPECARRARVWQDEIAGGAAVVLVDSDLVRENRTAPGGLALGGKVAALAAGRRQAFIQYYPLVTNLDVEPPWGRPVRDERTDFAAALRERLERAKPTTIVWHFAQPTQWERWLADRLTDLGGERRAVDRPPYRRWRTPALDRPIEVVTPWERREPALRLIDELARLAATEPRCVRVETLTTETMPKPVVVLAGRDGAGAERPPEWAFAGFHEVREGDREVAPGPVAAMAADTPADGHARWRVMLANGHSFVAEPSTGTLRPIAERLPDPVGLDCAAWLADRWWGVDPVAGTVTASHDPGWSPPVGRWSGIARAGEALVLASADQFLLVLDPATGRELTRFPAVVPPSRRLETGECTPVVAGDGFVATLDATTALFVYDAHGRARGAVPLARLLGVPPHRVAALAAHGRHLGVGTGFDQRVFTLRIDVAPDCPA